MYVVGFGARGPSKSGKLKLPPEACVQFGVARNVRPNKFSPTIALYPVVRLSATQPIGDATGSPVSGNSVRSTIGGGRSKRTPGVGFGCGEPLSNTRPRGGPWKNVVGSLSM